MSWWAELLEIPCVGYAANPDEVAPLAQAGADFVALGDWIWTQPQGGAAAIAAAPKFLPPPCRHEPARAGLMTGLAVAAIALCRLAAPH